MSSLHEFTYLSTFAGCGGSSLGYKWAGGKGVAAVEFDANAAATYRANFDTPVLERDIASVTAEEILALTGLQVGELDILDGSPPCQGFSTAGSRVMTDPRNSLFKEYVRLVEGLQPKVFVMENVSGMVKGKMKFVFRDIMLALKDTGYNVKCKLLNAMYYEVPQSRERLIWIGVRGDLNKEPSFPAPVGKPITVRKALKGYENEHGTPPGGTLLQIISIMPQGAKNGSGIYSHKIVGKKQFFGVNRLHWDKVSPTIIKTYQRMFHPDFNAPLSTNQAKLLASFPIEYKFNGSESDAWQRIGNCVPPRFMYHIANHIKNTILKEAT